MISTIGAFTMAVGMLVFVAERGARPHARGRRAVNDPWLADTLEWYATSPPPPWNFERIPYIISARPLRDLRRRLTRGGPPVIAAGPWARLLAVGRARRDRPRRDLGRGRLAHRAPAARRARAAAADRAARDRVHLVPAPRCRRRSPRSCSSASPRS